MPIDNRNVKKDKGVDDSWWPMMTSRLTRRALRRMTSSLRSTTRASKGTRVNTYSHVFNVFPFAMRNFHHVP
jgi:hypothetical protein